jgi:hypothetical protein
MPSVSKKQHNLMAAVANNPAFAKKTGIPQSVGEDFTAADKGKKFGSGGEKTRVDSQGVNKPKTNHGDMALFKKGGTMATKMGKPVMKAGMSTAKAGMKKPTPMANADMAGSMMGMKKGGMKKMAAGGLSSGHKSANGIAQQGKTKGKQIVMAGNKGMKSGGMAKKYC